MKSKLYEKKKETTKQRRKRTLSYRVVLLIAGVNVRAVSHVFCRSHASWSEHWKVLWFEKGRQGHFSFVHHKVCCLRKISSCDYEFAFYPQVLCNCVSFFFVVVVVLLLFFFFGFQSSSSPESPSKLTFMLFVEDAAEKHCGRWSRYVVPLYLGAASLLSFLLFWWWQSMRASLKTAVLFFFFFRTKQLLLMCGGTWYSSFTLFSELCNPCFGPSYSSLPSADLPLSSLFFFFFFLSLICVRPASSFDYRGFWSSAACWHSGGLDKSSQNERNGSPTRSAHPFSFLIIIAQQHSS